MRTPSPLALLGVLCVALPVLAAPPPKLLEARKLMDDLEMEAALKALDAADKTEGNDRAAVLEIWQLQGIAFGSLGKDAKTRDSFRKLLMFNPGAALPPDQPPRVRTPFMEAKEWARTNGPVEIQGQATKADGVVKALTITVDKDVLRLIRTARFHFKAGASDETVDVAVTAGKAELALGKASVSWWVELLTERKGALATVGSAAAPREDGVAAAVVAAGPSGHVETERIVSGGWRRPTGFVLLGAGAVAAGVGALFGVQANAARATLNGATKDDQGRVTSVTQLAAGTLEAQANSQAALANVLFGVGGALGAAGVVFVILGPVTEPIVAFAPAPGGFVVNGSF